MEEADKSFRKMSQMNTLKKFLPHILLILLIAGLVACGRYVHIVSYLGSVRTFDSAEEARAYHRQNIERDLSAVTALASPIAGPVLVVLPPREELERLVRSDVLRSSVPNLPEEFLQAAVDREEDSMFADAEVVRRSNIFSDVRVVRSDNAEPTMAPSEGYLIWTTIAYEGVRRYIIAAGEQEFTEFASTSGPASERIRDWLAQIETYVKIHIPAK